jgi:DNA-binding transcriptional ArsR family regulator
LRILAMVTATPVSATDVAAATGLAHAAASYHLRQLAAAGLVDLVDKPDVAGRAGRPRRTYRMRQEPFRDLGPESSQLLNRALLSELDRRLQGAGSGTRTVDAEVWLSEDDWRQVTDLVQEASTIVHERALQPGTGASRHVGFTTLLVDLP